jgi:hypothetical protein
MHKYEFYGTWDDCDFYWDTQNDIKDEELKRYIQSRTTSDINTSNKEPVKNIIFNATKINVYNFHQNKKYKKQKK